MVANHRSYTSSDDWQLWSPTIVRIRVRLLPTMIANHRSSNCLQQPWPLLNNNPVTTTHQVARSWWYRVSGDHRSCRGTLAWSHLSTWRVLWYSSSCCQPGWRGLVGRRAIHSQEYVLKNLTILPPSPLHILPRSPELAGPLFMCGKFLIDHIITSRGSVLLTPNNP